MSEQDPIGPVYDFSPDSAYWRAVDSVGQAAEDNYAEQPLQHSGRDLARVRRGPDAATVLRGLPTALRGDTPIERVSSFAIRQTAAPRRQTAAQAMMRMAQGPLRPPGHEGM